MTRTMTLLMLPLLAALTVACGDKESDTSSGGGDADAGSTVFSTNCATCHAPDGSGTSAGPSLIDRVPGLAEADIEDQITNGGEAMPSFGSLSDQEVEDVIAYLVETFG